ncbi:unnamed protein product [Triticum turgidum subsp. durum]|uniref:Plant heme peroxidase family profile domain-containing protein n=1 Tax=Triticum turgidum subsp. durum TaxID=4567 RepID=A0A9R0VJW5_TRITD|nr:unnamed protein product [Triticum turgidum subsp. durum]
MATSMVCLVALCLVSPLLLAGAVVGNPGYGGLFPQFYDNSCPKAKEMVHSIVAQAVARETRMAASLVRLHFHDCFVKGATRPCCLTTAPTSSARRGPTPTRTLSGASRSSTRSRPPSRPPAPAPSPAPTSSPSPPATPPSSLAGLSGTCRSGGGTLLAPASRAPTKASRHPTTPSPPSSPSSSAWASTSWTSSRSPAATPSASPAAPASGRGCTTSRATASPTARWTCPTRRS